MSKLMKKLAEAVIEGDLDDVVELTEEAVEKEDFERASLIRDEINSRK